MGDGECHQQALVDLDKICFKSFAADTMVANSYDELQFLPQVCRRAFCTGILFSWGEFCLLFQSLAYAVLRHSYVIVFGVASWSGRCQKMV